MKNKVILSTFSHNYANYDSTIIESPSPKVKEFMKLISIEPPIEFDTNQWRYIHKNIGMEDMIQKIINLIDDDGVNFEDIPQEQIEEALDWEKSQWY